MSTEAAAEQGEFNPVIAAAITVVGIFSFVSYLVFAAVAPDLSGQDDGRANALSHSAVGFAALGEFLQANGIPVLVNRGLPAAEIAKASLFVITPSIGDTKADIMAVSAAEPKLIVLPKWSVAPDPQHPGWVSKIGINSTQSISRLLSAFSAGSSISRDGGSEAVQLNSLTTSKIEQLQTISGADWIGYVLDARQHAVVSRLTGSRIYALADPDLLNTRGLKDLDTARTAIAVIQSLRANDGPVILDVTLNGYRHSPNFLKLLLEAPFLGATLCGLVAALLIGANAAVRFGAPSRAERAFAFGKSALIDNSSALIAMDHRREARMIRRYAVVVRRDVARAIGVATGEDDEILNSTLDQLRPKQATGPALSQIFAEAGEARTVSDAMRVARKLHRWRGEMLHGA